MNSNRNFSLFAEGETATLLFALIIVLLCANKNLCYTGYDERYTGQR